ncbi:MAG: hypothetical protein ABIV28_02400 [Longimicrobiales bacterium]
MMRTPTAVPALALAASLLAVPAITSAQSCNGAPMADGQFALGAGAGFTKDLNDYGIGLQANLRGPISLLAAYRNGDHDETADPLHNYVGAVLYEVQASKFSVCPRVQITHSRFDGTHSGVETKSNTNVIGLGVGIGRTFPTGTAVAISPFILPEVMLVKTTGEVIAFGTTQEFDSDENGFGVTVGATFGVKRLMFTTTAQFSNLTDSHPFYTIGLGFHFP